jgi:hypothetical protein
MVKTEDCPVGQLRLSYDKDHRLTKAEFFHGKKRVGPTLTLEPEKESGRYFKKGDSHDFSYSYGRSYMHTVWDDEAQKGHERSYESWIELCLEDLRSRGWSLLFERGKKELKAKKWEAAKATFSRLSEGWGKKPTVWMNPDDPRNEQFLKRIQLRLELARYGQSGSGADALEAAWFAVYESCEELEDLEEDLKLIAGEEGLLEAWLNWDMRRLVKQSKSNLKKIQSGLEERFNFLRKIKGAQKVFVEVLIQSAKEFPALVSFAGFYGLKQTGASKEKEKAVALLEDEAAQGAGKVHDLNNLAQEYLNSHQLEKARDTLDKVENILKESPDPNELKRIEDECFYSLHRATYYWLKKDHQAALPFAERAYALENQERELVKFVDPFTDQFRYGVARSGGAWAYLSVLTGLGRGKEADAEFLKILNDAQVMQARLRFNADGAQHMLMAGLCIYLDDRANSKDEMIALSRVAYKHARAIVPKPENSRLTYTYACLESHYGNKKNALKYLKLSLAQGFPKSHARNDQDFEAISNEVEFKRLVR